MHRTPIRSSSAFPREGAQSRRRFCKRCLCGLAAFGLFFVTAGNAWPDLIYWCDFNRGEIRRANLDGTGVTTLVSGLVHPFGPALDLAGGQMYWGEGIGVIQRANLDGTGLTTLVTGQDVPETPVLDVAAGQMYWTDWNGGGRFGVIRRANLDGTGLTTLVTGLSSPNNLALDIAGGKMYWGNNGFPFEGIQRANLDGSAQENLFALDGQPQISGITLDVADGKMYWSYFDAPGGNIRRANLDGSGEEILVSDLNNPGGVTLDVARGQMYWADFGSGDIRRANLDGTGQEILITGLGNPSGLALDLGSPGTAVFYAIAAPASVPPKTAFDLAITAADPYGNIDVNYKGTVTFSTSDTDPGIILPTDYTFTADDRGVHTFPGAVSLSTTGDQTVTVTDTASGITRTATVTVVAPN